MRPTKSRSWFTRLTKWTAHAAGRPATFTIAVTVILLWGVTGPYFGYSDTWQLVINTGTTVVTFLMVFVIQNAQNRDSKAIHAKLDELIRSIAEARDELITAEDESEEVLDRRLAELQALAASDPALRRRLSDRLEHIARGSA
jgi:low affinity Fe/Cu permease